MADARILRVSGFTRDSKHYGDHLVYEALGSKWSRYHARCGCGQDWVTAHAEQAGFTVVRRGSGFVALVGPGLTEGVDETKLTTNALWQAVTGTPGTQDWYETVRLFERSEHEDGESEKVRKTTSAADRAARRERDAAAKREPLTEAQLNYLRTLVTKVSRERFDDEFNSAIRGSTVKPRQPEEKTAQLIKRLTKSTARKLITALVGSS
ncbi:MAG: hypothetical protein QOE61_1079 [Micromonosporaceae bacterium]|nr:hypothetical protein [Micromonosporaceae bacterium]